MLALAEAGKNIKIVMGRTKAEDKLNTYIEHTYLKPDATKQIIERLCEEAKENEFYGVCIPPYFIPTAKKKLDGTKIKIITVIGFPMGYSTTYGKAEEAKRAIQDGADELDMVMNIAAFKSGDLAYVKKDIQGLSDVCRLSGKTLKVIIETGLLSEKEIISICNICEDAGVAFIKTSTGMNGVGVSLNAVRIIKENLHKKTGIKASGGISDGEFARELIKAGASRIGSSSSVNLVNS